AKARCRGFVFKSVGDRDVADAAYRDVFTAVLKTNTRCLAATEPASGPPTLSPVVNQVAPGHRGRLFGTAVNTSLYAPSQTSLFATVPKSLPLRPTLNSAYVTP